MMVSEISDYSGVNLLPQNGSAYYFKNFFSKDESDFLFNIILAKTNWKHEHIKIFSKDILQPRLTAFHGELEMTYSYSGITMIPLPMSDELLFIKQKIETITNTKYNVVLSNLYRNGNDSMGWHADNEKKLGKNPSIASVSFGESRVLKFKHIYNKLIKTEIELQHGSLLIMRDETQHFWQHSISKSKKITQSRINLTFRKII